MTFTPTPTGNVVLLSAHRMLLPTNRAANHGGCLWHCINKISFQAVVINS